MNYLEMATRLAKADVHKYSAHRKNFLFSGVAVRQDGSITCGNNILTELPNPNAHAEKRILSKAGYGATLYLVRIKRDGTWAMAKPCRHCETFIKNMKVRKVVYTVGPNRYEVWIPF